MDPPHPPPLYRSVLPWSVSPEGTPVRGGEELGRVSGVRGGEERRRVSGVLGRDSTNPSVSVGEETDRSQSARSPFFYVDFNWR